MKEEEINMKVTRDTLHEIIDKVNESELHKIYDMLQSILDSNEIITNPREVALRNAKRNIKRSEVVSLYKYLIIRFIYLC
ncbi:hypothetical protein ACFTSE_26495 [Bacillus cereus]|uniref:hypothetical protein n=1 Tax=Bacillus cereus TaxID=1396 RepID=UPI0036275D70